MAFSLAEAQVSSTNKSWIIEYDSGSNDGSCQHLLRFLMEPQNISQYLTLNNFCLFLLFVFFILVGVNLFASYFNPPLSKTKIFREHATVLLLNYHWFETICISIGYDFMEIIKWNYTVGPCITNSHSSACSLHYYFYSNQTCTCRPFFKRRDGRRCVFCVLTHVLVRMWAVIIISSLLSL